MNRTVSENCDKSFLYSKNGNSPYVYVGTSASRKIRHQLIIRSNPRPTWFQSSIVCTALTENCNCKTRFLFLFILTSLCFPTVLTQGCYSFYKVSCHKTSSISQKRAPKTARPSSIAQLILLAKGKLFRSLIAYFAMDKSKIPKNCLSEVWYITFTMLISTIKK